MALPAILLTELLAGMALGAAWPELTAPRPQVPQSAMTAVTVPSVAVPLQQVVPTPAAVTVPTHAPRNPFGVPHGVDAGQYRPAAPALQPPATATAPVAPPGLTVPTETIGDPFARAATPAR